MKLIAFVKENVFPGRLQYIERDYKSKKDFRSDLHGNGYIIRYIHTEKEQESWLDYLNHEGGYMCFHSVAYRMWRRKWNNRNKGVDNGTVD